MMDDAYPSSTRTTTRTTNQLQVMVHPVRRRSLTLNIYVESIIAKYSLWLNLTHCNKHTVYYISHIKQSSL